MKKHNKQFNLDNNTQATKAELKKLGADLQRQAQEPQARLKAQLKEIYSKTPENKKNKAKDFFKKRLVLFPATGVIVILIAVLVINSLSSPVSIRQTADYSMNDISQPKSRSFAPDMNFEGVGTQTGLSASSGSTFKENFLKKLGQHEADPDDMAQKGSLLEKDYNIDLLTKEKIRDVEMFAKNAFDSNGGYIENIDQNYARYSKGLVIHGKIPADKVDYLRYSLMDYVEKEKYYQEYIQAQSRTADVVVIEDKIKEVEVAINYLEEAIKREDDLTKKAQLQKELAEHQSYLKERNQTKENIMDRVEFVDVSLTIKLLPSIWKAQNNYDIRLSLTGFEEASLWNNLMINVLRIIIIFLKTLSYTFWLIPIIIWLILRRRKNKKMMRALE